MTTWPWTLWMSAVWRGTWNKCARKNATDRMTARQQLIKCPAEAIRRNCVNRCTVETVRFRVHGQRTVDNDCGREDTTETTRVAGRSLRFPIQLVTMTTLLHSDARCLAPRRATTAGGTSHSDPITRSRQELRPAKFPNAPPSVRLFPILP